MFGWKKQALRGLSSSYPSLSCLPHSLPALPALGGGEWRGEKKNRGKRKIRCTMVTPVTMEIMVHSEMGRLDFEEEEEGEQREGSARAGSINS